jgi:methionyl aminopeptidase
MIKRNEACWCGSEKKWKKCHYPQKSPVEIKDGVAKEYWNHFQIILKSPQQIEGIRAASKLAAKILDATCLKACEGVTTNELNSFAHQLHKDAGATPAPLGYGEPPFPKSICTSINEVICHGIPDDEPLKKGDIINIDVTAILDGFYGDCSRMVVVGGETTPERQLVVDTSYECLMQSIEILKPGALISDIGKVIDAHAKKKKCSVVHQFVAHGVGVQFHEAPQIPHHTNQLDIPLYEGMTFTIEPMINAGVAEGEVDPKDQWTARTLDRKASGQWEHTVLITSDGYEILTSLD